jgi:hypothetical protein
MEPLMMRVNGIKAQSRLGAVGLAVCLVLLAAAMPAQSSSPGVALVTGLSGEATYWNAGDKTKPKPLRAFMKIHRGDRIKLPAGALLQILYLTPGRQEAWKGPVTLTAGEAESQVAPGLKATPPEVKLLPTRVTRKIGGAELPLPSSSLRQSGVIRTMGGQPDDSPKTPGPGAKAAREAVREAQQTYAKLRRQTPAGDLTPELYYLSVLAENGKYPEMEKFIDKLQEKEPGNATLKELRAWARTQSLKKPQP